VSFKAYNFRCSACRHEFDDLSRYSDALGTVEPVPCPQCASDAHHFWKMGTKLAMRGDTFSDADALTAAAFLGIDVEKHGLPSRSKVERLAKERGLVRTTAREFDEKVLEEAHREDAPPVERELSKDEVDSYRAVIAEQTHRIQVAKDNGALPREASISDLPAEVRKQAGV